MNLENPNEKEETEFIHLQPKHIQAYPDLIFKDGGAEIKNTPTLSYVPWHRRIFAGNQKLFMEEREFREAEERRRKYKNVQCVNCGEKGHVVKDCDAPITSFGIIAFKTVYHQIEERFDVNPRLQNILDNINNKDKNIKIEYPKIKFLMIQRKDTMGYIDFVRGKYPDNDSYAKEKLLKVCLNEMTAKEKENLLNNSFDAIWDDLWVNHESKCYKNEKTLAKMKFERLDIKSLVTQSETRFDFQEFSFPKGRKNMKEQNIACAEREFFEETGYGKEHYHFIKNYPTIHEEFMGTNGVAYRHIYYLVKMKDNIPPPKIDHTNIVQTGEVQNIGWFTFEECLSLIRPYDTAKTNALKKVYRDILDMKEQYECSHFYHRGKTNHWNRFDNNYGSNDYRSFVFKSRSL
jgi:8-oxo-dGTP pyrophosphatase MutT (NUDIX family)